MPHRSNRLAASSAERPKSAAPSDQGLAKTGYDAARERSCVSFGSGNCEAATEIVYATLKTGSPVENRSGSPVTSLDAAPFPTKISEEGFARRTAPMTIIAASSQPFGSAEVTEKSSYKTPGSS